MIIRRTFLNFFVLATMIFLLQACTAQESTTSDEISQSEMTDTQAADPIQVVRKSASNMTEEERERFMLGWDLLIESGKLGSIASEHEADADDPDSRAIPKRTGHPVKKPDFCASLFIRNPQRVWLIGPCPAIDVDPHKIEADRQITSD
ncbi:MAG: hypothetical protein AAF633_12085 [Chloroflexota bacterium]